MHLAVSRILGIGFVGSPWMNNPVLPSDSKGPHAPHLIRDLKEIPSTFTYHACIFNGTQLCSAFSEAMLFFHVLCVVISMTNALLRQTVGIGHFTLLCTSHVAGTDGNIRRWLLLYCPRR